MSDDPRLADQAKARADLASTPTNPAENDFDGMCIQCTERRAKQLKLFATSIPTSCGAFCSLECAELFAFEMANNLDGPNPVHQPTCKHYVLDGEFCLTCRDEFLAAAQAAKKVGAA